MTSVGQAIDAIRSEWGEKLLILGHHYQRSSVLQHADETGDSLELARKAAARPDADRIVFCGVRFMAESADILSGASQAVYMPDMSAGCPMANMATADSMMAAYETLSAHGDDWLPVVYVNSTAEVKACCGRLGGSTCTSSNAAKVFEWVFARGKRVFFLPDEHLGVNTAQDLGIPNDRVLVWDPKQPGGGLDAGGVEAARVVVWKGFCIVHVAFTTEQVARVRKALPDAKIIVHPEAPREVVSLVDAHGSTAQIIKYVEGSADGATIVIGTEVNLVERLAEKCRGRVTVKVLSPSVCANMSKTNEENLLSLLRDWPEQARISVPGAVAADARKSLTTMLEL